MLFFFLSFLTKSLIIDFLSILFVGGTPGLLFFCEQKVCVQYKINTEVLQGHFTTGTCNSFELQDGTYITILIHLGIKI